MNHSVTLSRSIKAMPSALFRAFSTPAGLMDWCANAVEMDVPKGRYFYLWAERGYHISGSVGMMVENERLDWHIQSPAVGAVRIKIQEVDAGVSQLSFSMSGDYRGDEHLAFWNAALNNLEAVLETGLDRRVYDRPMLGVLIGGLMDADLQARFNAPHPYGIIVSGTVAGMGAEALGLQEGDILTRMGGVEIHDYSDLHSVVEGYRAGDSVRVNWYRGGESHTGLLTFSGRPAPFVPEYPSELADYVSRIYDRLEDELADLLDGVSESASGVHPGEQEWSIKEILAHIILTERSSQQWIVAIKEGEHMRSWHSGDMALVRSLVSVYPTLDELQSEIRRAHRQTLELVRRLPPELTHFKSPYTMIATMLGEQGQPIHTRMHLETIRSLIAESTV